MPAQHRWGLQATGGEEYIHQLGLNPSTPHGTTQLQRNTAGAIKRVGESSLEDILGRASPMLTEHLEAGQGCFHWTSSAI